MGAQKCANCFSFIFRRVPCKFSVHILHFSEPLAVKCGYYSIGFSERKGHKLTSDWKILTCMNEK